MSRQIVVQYALAERAGVPAANTIRRWAEAALAPANKAATLTIRLVDVAEIQALNRRFRQQDKPTNVLAFPAPETLRQQHGLLGDVLVCVAVAASEAQRQHKRLADHLTHLVIHGVLHLQGHEHDDPVQAEQMESEERRILTRLGIADPYLLS